MSGILEGLLAHPIFLVPILIIVASMVYALLKKLLKLALILLIAGALYMFLIEYVGTGM